MAEFIVKQRPIPYFQSTQKICNEKDTSETCKFTVYEAYFYAQV